MKPKRQIKTLIELFLVFFKIGLFTFGGGYAMISFFERELIEKRGWITEKEMNEVIIVAESTPGPIAVNSATFIGFKLWGIIGGLVATLGAVLPSFIVITAVYYFYDAFRTNLYIAAAFKGIRSAVVVLIFNAFLKLSKNMKKTTLNIAISAITFILASFFNFSAIYYILVGGLFGIIYFIIKERIKKRKLLNDLEDENE